MARGKFEYWLTKDGLTLLRGWARQGLTDEQLAEKIGINRATLYDWKKKYPNISNALKTSKEIVDIQVENALLKWTPGYDFQEKRAVTVAIAEAFINGMTAREQLTVARPGSCRKHPLADIAKELVSLTEPIWENPKAKQSRTLAAEGPLKKFFPQAGRILKSRALSRRGPSGEYGAITRILPRREPESNDQRGACVSDPERRTGQAA